MCRVRVSVACLGQNGMVLVCLEFKQALRYRWAEFNQCADDCWFFFGLF